MSDGGHRKSARIVFLSGMSLSIIASVGLALAYVRSEWDPPKLAFFAIVALGAAAVGAATVQLWLGPSHFRRLRTGRGSLRIDAAEASAAEFEAVVGHLADAIETLEARTGELERRAADTERGRQAERRARRRT